MEDIASEMSIEGEAQFALFGGSKKTAFLEDQKVLSFHLYLFVHTVVTNPQVVKTNLKLKPEAYQLLAADPQRFHEEFGDFFVVGKQTGGEYAALFEHKYEG